MIRALAVTLFILLTQVLVEGKSKRILVSPNGPITTKKVNELLEKKPEIREIILKSGKYHNLSILGKAGENYKKRPLLIRPAKGADVVFDGAKDIEDFQETDFHGVFTIPWNSKKITPKMWEPNTRTRYKLVADKLSVQHYQGSFTLDDGMIYFHTSNNKSPRELLIQMSHADFGIFISRSNVKIKGLYFRNYTRRTRYSTAINTRKESSNVIIENCIVKNASMGFIIAGKNNIVKNCRIDDCGTGIYVQGENIQILGNELFKIRDNFQVPIYFQEDTGIEFYYPAKGGIARDNLCVGFGNGVFIKANIANYKIEHNTLVGGAGCLRGFGSTKWSDQHYFQNNIVAEFPNLIEVPKEATEKQLAYNCFWNEQSEWEGVKGEGSVFANPQFYWPENEDYRVLEDSPVIKLKSRHGIGGAFSVINFKKIKAPPIRKWYVSPNGADGRNGSINQPVKRIQYAINRVRPGDTIVVLPGLYTEPIKITQGGTKSHPITLKSEKKWEAVLDTNKEHDVIILIEKAPHIIIQDFEIRWYKKNAIKITESPYSIIEGCKIWNEHWNNAWPEGTAIKVIKSHHFSAIRNICFRQEHAIWIYNSPSSSILGNTCVGNLYSGVCFLNSIRRSICRNNSLAFNDTVSLLIYEKDKKPLTRFQCDYNNYGTHLRKMTVEGAMKDGKPYDSIVPRSKDHHLKQDAKGIFNYYTKVNGKNIPNRIKSLKEWQKYSGLDKNSIVKDPLYIDSFNRNFNLESKSHNIGAGYKKQDIGALPYHLEKL